MNDINDIYKNTEEYDPNKKCKILIAFDDMVADMFSKNKLDLKVTEFFIRDRKLNIFVSITQSYFDVAKNIRLNSTHLIIHQILTFKTL